MSTVNQVSMISFVYGLVLVVLFFVILILSHFWACCCCMWSWRTLLIFETSAVVLFSSRVFFDGRSERSARAADTSWHRGRRLRYHNVAMWCIFGDRCSIYKNGISVLSGIFFRRLFVLLQVTTLIIFSCSSVHFSILCGSWGMFAALMNVLTVQYVQIRAQLTPGHRWHCEPFSSTEVRQRCNHVSPRRARSVSVRAIKEALVDFAASTDMTRMNEIQLVSWRWPFWQTFSFMVCRYTGSLWD